MKIAYNVRHNAQAIRKTILPGAVDFRLCQNDRYSKEAPRKDVSYKRCTTTSYISSNFLSSSMVLINLIISCFMLNTPSHYIIITNGEKSCPFYFLIRAKYFHNFQLP